MPAPRTVILLPLEGAPIILENDISKIDDELKVCQRAVGGLICALDKRRLKIRHFDDPAWKVAAALVALSTDLWANDDGMAVCEPNLMTSYDEGAGPRPIFGNMAVVVPSRLITDPVRAVLQTRRLIGKGKIEGGMPKATGIFPTLVAAAHSVAISKGRTLIGLEVTGLGDGTTLDGGDHVMSAKAITAAKATTAKATTA